MRTNIKLTQKMKRQNVIGALKADYSALDIARFMKVARSVVVKIRKITELC